MRRRVLLLVAVALAVLTAGTTVTLATRAEQADVPINQLIVQRGEMPVGTQWVEEGRHTAGDPRDILLAKSADRVADYSDNYFAFAVGRVQVQSPDGKPDGKTASAPVIQQVYRYASEADAASQWEQLAKTFRAAPKATVLSIGDQPAAGGGQVALQTFGREGEAIHWFLSVRGKVLTTLCVDDLQAFDGVARPSGRAFFETIVASLQRK